MAQGCRACASVARVTALRHAADAVFRHLPTAAGAVTGGRVQLAFRRGAIWAMACGIAAAAMLGSLLLRPDAPDPLPLPAAVVALAGGVQAKALDDEPQGAALPWVAEGRVQAAPPHGIWHEWPGIALSARFEGDALHIALDDPENRFRVLVDGVVVALITRPGKATVALSGLGQGAHDLRLERLSEAGVPRQIVSIAVPPPGRPLPAPALPQRRIDVYGDSDTVGYGLARGDRHCAGDDVFLSTDTTLAYPALLARRLGVGTAVMARSGIGLIRGHGGSPSDQNLLALHDRALPAIEGTAGAGAPWLIVVEVGGNDFAQPPQAGEPWADEAALSAAFLSAYDGFLRALMHASPGTPVLVLALPDAGRDVRPEIVAVAERLAAEGAPVRLVPVRGLDYRGCHWHPSAADHARVADTLADAVGSLIALGLLEDG